MLGVYFSTSSVLTLILVLAWHCFPPFSSFFILLKNEYRCQWHLFRFSGFICLFIFLTPFPFLRGYHTVSQFLPRIGRQLNIRRALKGLFVQIFSHLFKFDLTTLLQNFLSLSSLSFDLSFFHYWCFIYLIVVKGDGKEFLIFCPVTLHLWVLVLEKYPELINDRSLDRTPSYQSWSQWKYNTTM